MGATSTIGAVGLGLQAGGAVFNAFGQYNAGQLNAETLKTNKKIADAQGADAILRGKAEEVRYRSSVKQLMGEQKAVIAAQGIDISFGSALDLQLDAAYWGELNALTIRTDAAREAWGYQVQAAGYGMQAVTSEYSGIYGAASTILGGATQVFLNTRGMKVPTTNVAPRTGNSVPSGFRM